MRKFLSVIAFAIAAVGLIIGGVIVFAQLGDASSAGDAINIQNSGLQIGLGLGLLGGGIGCAVGAIANFFTAKTKDK